jgi:hypothetical protein
MREIDIEVLLRRYEDLFCDMKSASQEGKVRFLNRCRAAVIELKENPKPSDFDLILFVLDCPLTAREFLK